MIDDERTIAHVVQVLLESCGHEVLVADDGSRGFATAKRHRPDVIILDVMMPVMDGLAALDALRIDEATRSIPVLVLSALEETDLKGRAPFFGPAAYIRKPFESDELLRTVEDLCTSSPENGT